jgi:hypothetical protein
VPAKNGALFAATIDAHTRRFATGYQYCVSNMNNPISISNRLICRVFDFSIELVEIKTTL